MSKKLTGRWKPHSVYTHVTDNKNGNLEAARQNLGINVQLPKPIVNIVDNNKPLADSNKSSHDDENEDSDSDD